MEETSVDDYRKQQWRPEMGLSVDYSRDVYTHDEGLSKAVHQGLCRALQKGWIYRGEFIIAF